MYSPLIDILFGDFIISKKIHLWNFYFYRTHVNYDRINVTFSKGFKSIIKDHAKEQGESVNAFIIRAVNETIQRETN